MPLTFEPMVAETPLTGHAVFLSASIPDAERWAGAAFDPLEITDAVVAAGRAVLHAGGTLVTAAHPTIAPLLLYVAAEFPPVSGSHRIVVYQSQLFEAVLPEPTVRFRDEGIGEFRWTPSAPGDVPEPGRWGESLRTMRRAMLTDMDPVGAIFIGGMEGISDEYQLVRDLLPNAPVYPVGRPGGAARALSQQVQSPLTDLLQSGDVYPALFRHVVQDIVQRLEGNG
jgi:hypothetical protein